MTRVRPSGYYHAEGDPVGTVRYWDGARWSGEPKLIPERAMPSAPEDASHYASTGPRVGAALADIGITIAAVVAFAVAADPFVGLVVVPLVYYALTVVMTARMGGSPGKLLLGLRVTLSDGTTSPPGAGPSFVRTLPLVVGAVPGLGGLLAGLLNLANIRLVSRDDERRSVHDRFGQTRVVHRDRLL
ncbi:MAG: RDD family protein [Actinomycetota bacterium]